MNLLTALLLGTIGFAIRTQVLASPKAGHGPSHVTGNKAMVKQRLRTWTHQVLEFDTRLKSNKGQGTVDT